jgi:thioredoxin reductase (NADPH)
MTVDDDPEVLRSVERDLRRKYAHEYRVLRADSGPAALDALGQLKLRGDAVALLLVDQRMPGMSGVEFLEQALQIYPDTKRALLTAYADTTAAIAAINNVKVDYYLLKPWDPPERELYPVLDDLLDDWKENHRPPFEGLRVLGQRWSPQSHAIRDFLGRNHVPYQWIDVEAAETDAEARRLLSSVEADARALPLVLFEDGSRLNAPTPEQIAEKVGLRTHAETSFYDLVIVGAGPAGLGAGVYGASEGLTTVMIEREAPGGQAGMSSRIENYLGFPSGIRGDDLARRAVVQAKRFGVEILTPQEAVGLRQEGPYRIVSLKDGGEVSCHALLIATGLHWRSLDVPGVGRLQGAGVYYGSAMTEAMSCAGEDVYVIGGANSAGQAAMYFSRYARTVNMVVRENSLVDCMSQYLIHQIETTPNIIVEFSAEVLEAHGDGHLEELTIVNRANGATRTASARALFIFIGAVPCTAWLGGQLAIDEDGYLLSGPYLMKDGKRPKSWPLDRDPMLFESSIPGVFVAGDTRHGSVKRVASGVGEGAMCVQMIHRYLAKVR